MKLPPLLLTLLAVVLSGCQSAVMSPGGAIAVQQRNLLVVSTFLMLLIIIPVMALTIWFAWKYRHTNPQAVTTYAPDWEHSTMLELLIWSAPLLIIIALGALTWMGTHLLDPYRPLTAGRGVKGVTMRQTPLEVDVVALDWKWLFIYPEQHLATVNQLVVPVGRTINFHITASSVMNSFYIPTLAGQIYAMPAMETQLHAVAGRVETSQGFSANYSGAGFSGMHFPFYAVAPQAFTQWVEKIHHQGGQLSRTEYQHLAAPSENVAPGSYGSVDTDLYPAILNLCVAPGQQCQTGMGMMSMPMPAVKEGARADQPGMPMLASQTTPIPGKNPAAEQVSGTNPHTSQEMPPMHMDTNTATKNEQGFTK